MDACLQSNESLSYTEYNVILQNRSNIIVARFTSDHNDRDVPLDVQLLIFSFYTLESMQVMQSTRLNILKVNSLANTLDIELQMLHTSCFEAYHPYHGTVVREVLGKWIEKTDDVNDITFTDESFKYRINMFIEQCIVKNNIKILKILLKFGKYNIQSLVEMTSTQNYEEIEARKDCVIECISFAAGCGALQCLKLLLQAPDLLNWTEQLRPVMLLNAIRYKSHNLELVHFIVDRLAMAKICFVCDDIMEEIIERDMVEIGQRVVALGWHQISNCNKELAAQVNGRCIQWLTERDVNANMYNNNECALDLDEWEEESDCEWDGSEENEAWDVEEETQLDIDTIASLAPLIQSISLQLSREELVFTTSCPNLLY